MYFARETVEGLFNSDQARSKAAIGQPSVGPRSGNLTTLVGGFCRRRRKMLSSNGSINFAESAKASSDFAADGPTAATEPLLLYFTSGTTTKPKLVEHSHQSYPVGHLSTMYWIGLREGDVHLNISSPGWAKHAWSCFFAPWNAGATIFIYNYSRFTAEAVLDVITRCGVTTLCAPPTVWRMLIDLLPDDWELWIDGGHNPAAADAIANEIRYWRDRPLHLVFGMLRNKDVDGFLRAIAPWCTGEFVTVTIPGELNSLSAEEAANAARSVGLNAEPAAGIREALSSLFGHGRNEPARVLIFGSLYLVGAVLKQ